MDDIAAGETVLVDAANVVGSRPTGWWRDRPGAARDLVERIRAAAVPGRPVVVVLEGAARAGVAESDEPGVTVVHAAGSGDDELAARAGPGTVLVTSDRELVRRAQAAGARTVGASRLWAELAGG